MITRILAAASTAMILAGATPPGGSPYWEPQTQPDCVEATTRVAIDQIKHRFAVSEKSIDAYAAKIGLYKPGLGSSGSAWPVLFAHYGVNARFGFFSRATITAALAKHESVIAVVNAETLWQPLGYVTRHPVTYADHAVVVESVSPAGVVTLADMGIPTGNGERQAWGTFSKAWSASGWQAVDVSR